MMITSIAFCIFMTSPIINDEWSPVFTEDGITAWEKSVPGRSFPIYRASGVLDANMYQLLAVLNDFSRHDEWALSMASDTRIVWRSNDFNFIMYGRFDAPWPIWDRDTIMLVEINFDKDKQEVKATFKDIILSQEPPINGVIRAPRTRIDIYMQYINKGQTFVSGTMDIDPGGNIPSWLVRMFSRRLSHSTLIKMRDQINKTQNIYTKFINKYDPNNY